MPAAFAYGDIEPLAAPGVICKALKWLFDPLGPLSIRPAYALKIAPWLLRVWQAESAGPLQGFRRGAGAP